MTVHRGVLRRGREDHHFLHSLSDPSGPVPQAAQMRFVDELDDGFARWLGHLDNGRILTGQGK